MGFSTKLQKIEKKADDRKRDFLASLQDITVSVNQVETQGFREYAVGTRLGTNEQVRVMLSDKRSSEGRSSLATLWENSDQLPGTLLQFRSSLKDRTTGVYEARDAVQVQASEAATKVFPPSKRQYVSKRTGNPYYCWTYAVHQVHTDEAVACGSGDEIKANAEYYLSIEGAGRPGVVIRGYDPEENTQVEFTLMAAFNADERGYRSGQETFAALEAPDAPTVSLTVTWNHEDGTVTQKFMRTDAADVRELMDSGMWEVIPLRVHNLRQFCSAEDAEPKNDLSKVFRLDPERPETGFSTASLVASGDWPVDVIAADSASRAYPLAALATINHVPQSEAVREHVIERNSTLPLPKADRSVAIPATPETKSAAEAPAAEAVVADNVAKDTPVEQKERRPRRARGEGKASEQTAEETAPAPSTIATVAESAQEDSPASDEADQNYDVAAFYNDSEDPFAFLEQNPHLVQVLGTLSDELKTDNSPGMKR